MFARPMPRAPWPRESTAHLRIRFPEGERPHIFWVSTWTNGPDTRSRYKVLSKRREDASIEVVVIEEQGKRSRRCIAREDIPANAPAGWLSRWVSELGSSLGIDFQRFDLRSIESETEWQETARRLGWTLGGKQGRSQH